MPDFISDQRLARDLIRIGDEAIAQPHGKPVAWDVMGMFRYDADSRLAEEWVQTDPSILVEQLRAP